MKVRDLPFIALALSLSRTGLGGTWMENGMIFSYSLSDDGGARVSIASCGVSASVVIPSEIDGHKVTGIEATSSDCLANLASVVIPNGVTYIGDDAFRGCSSLMSITLPDSVIRLGLCVRELHQPHVDNDSQRRDKHWISGVRLVLQSPVDHDARPRDLH